MAVGFLLQELNRRDAQRQALRLAQTSQKPILSVGAGTNPFGDVKCDIRPKQGVIYADAQNLAQFDDKQFSVAFLSHVLEHVEEPNKALNEANRVADHVVIVTPSPLFPPAWLSPQHKWVFLNGSKMRIRA